MLEVCAWMTDLGLYYSAGAFKKQEVDGAALAEFSEKDFISVLVASGGAIADITLVSKQLLRSTRAYLVSWW